MLSKKLSLYHSLFTIILYMIILTILIPFLFLIKMFIFYSRNLELLVFFDVFVLRKIINLAEDEINYCENLIEEIEREKEGKK